MANIIRIKRKTTSGPPSLASLAVGEMCLNIPDETLYWKKDALTLVGPYSVAQISGDMTKATYDANNDGKVDIAENAEKLGGTAAASYALQTWVTDQVNNAINSLVSAAPGALDTLNELANALGDDPDFAATITSALASKLSGTSTIDGGEIA